MLFAYSSWSLWLAVDCNGLRDGPFYFRGLGAWDFFPKKIIEPSKSQKKNNRALSLAEKKN